MMDYHTHTDFSDGVPSPQELIDAAVELGIAQLAVTDHFDPYDPACPAERQTVGSLKQHVSAVRACARGKPIQVFCGIETSTGPDGRLRLPAGALELCDLVITSVHYLDYDGPIKRGEYFNDGYWAAYRQKLLAQAAGDGHVLGHPEGYLPLGPMLEDGSSFEDRLAICAAVSRRYFDRAFIDAIGDALLQSGKAYELHGASGTPREWVVRRLHQKGVQFSIGSDAHGLDRLGCNARAMRMWRELGLNVLKLDAKGECFHAESR